MSEPVNDDNDQKPSGDVKAEPLVLTALHQSQELSCAEGSHVGTHGHHQESHQTQSGSHSPPTRKAIPAHPVDRCPPGGGSVRGAVRPRVLMSREPELCHLSGWLALPLSSSPPPPSPGPSPPFKRCRHTPAILPFGPLSCAR